jgi:two-component system nitrogen regulation sensor histidine kinase NtrY
MRLSRSLIAFLSCLLLIVLITAVEIHYLSMTTVELSTKIVLFGVMTFNVAAIITLIFFTIRNIYKLLQEKKKNIPGHRFKTKLALIFIIFALLPSLLLFIIASGLASNFIGQIFSPYLGGHLNLSMDMARGFYDHIQEQMLQIAEWAAKNKPPHGLPNTKTYKVKGGRDIPELFKDAMQGKRGTEVITGQEGDIIRAAVPCKDEKGCAVVAECVLPNSITSKVERLREFNEEYLKAISYKEPLKINYIIILGFVTLMIVFAGFWFSLKISTSITTPIKHLAIATEHIRRGDFSVRVDIKSDDEIGLLIESFNTMVTDLWDHKASLERAYQESDKRRLFLEMILENIRSGVLFLTQEGRIQTINKAALSMLRLSHDVTGTHYSELIARLNSEDLTKIVKGIQGRRYRSLQRQVKVNIEGIPSVINVFISDIINTNTREALGILVVFDDLTEIIKAEKALAWQEVARRIAHEIKNPLTPIRLSAERLLKKWQKGDSDFGDILERSLRTIINEVEGLRSLVDEFTKYGKMPELAKTKTDLIGLIEDIISLYKGFKEIKITLSAEEIPEIVLDRLQFKRALINIIDNAIRAMDSKGELTILVGLREDKVIIDISDTGPGIKEEDKDKLFMPYFTGVRGGTGLGLAITNKIITDHGGRIYTKANPSGGATFSIEIPAEVE